MQETTQYASPLGQILLSAQDGALTGVWFMGAKYCGPELSSDCREREIAVLTSTKRWLDVYFSGREPDFLPPLRLIGSPFQQAVWALLQQIPYGQTVTYGALAKRVAPGRKMSAQAVGGAVGRNPISILVPCHRVVGSDGSLTGYASGLDRKRFLLELEKQDRA